MPTPIRQPQQPIRTGYDQAFLECCQIVQSALQKTGIRWTAEAEQAAVCTLFIAADKHGHLEMWESPDILRPRPAIQAMPDPPAPKREERSPRPPAEDLTQVLARSIDAVNARRSQAPPVLAIGAAEPAKAEPWFPVMLRAFRELEQDLPPEVFSAVLEWYGASSPDQFTLNHQKQAIGCYLALKRAREECREKCQDPTSFEHFQAGEGL